MKNELVVSRNCYVKAIESIRRLQECPKAKISEEDYLAYIKHCREMEAISSEENAEKVCESKMHSIGDLLYTFLEKHNGEYPEDLVALLNFSMQRPLQEYETRNSVEEGIKSIFHCIADPDTDSGINYTYTKITQDAADGASVIACNRHSEKVIMLVKKGKRYEVLKLLLDK